MSAIDLLSAIAQHDPAHGAAGRGFEAGQQLGAEMSSGADSRARPTSAISRSSGTGFAKIGQPNFCSTGPVLYPVMRIAYQRLPQASHPCQGDTVQTIWNNNIGEQKIDCRVSFECPKCWLIVAGELDFVIACIAQDVGQLQADNRVIVVNEDRWFEKHDFPPRPFRGSARTSQPPASCCPNRRYPYIGICVEKPNGFLGSVAPVTQQHDPSHRAVGMHPRDAQSVTR